jgi:hypothetical protein
MSDRCPKCGNKVRDDVIRCTNKVGEHNQVCGQLLEKRIFDRKQAPRRGKIYKQSRELFPLAMQEPKAGLIGIVTTEDFVFYFAPCFGVIDTCSACGKTFRGSSPGCTKHDPYKHADMKCISADLLDSSPELDLADVTRRFGGRECLVYLPHTGSEHTGSYSGRKFGPNSHNALVAWINKRAGKSLPQQGVAGGIDSVQDDGTTLGFSIQHDSTGSYIRFASGRNEMKFTPRVKTLTELIVHDSAGNVRTMHDAEFVSGPTHSLHTAGAAAMELDKTKTLASPAAPAVAVKELKLTGRVVSTAGFTGRKDAAGAWEMKETRDLPKTWFEWGCRVLAGELNLELRVVDKPERYTTRGSGSTKKQYFTAR